MLRAAINWRSRIRWLRGRHTPCVFHIISIFRVTVSRRLIRQRWSGDGRGAGLSFQAVLQPSAMRRGRTKGCRVCRATELSSCSASFCWLSSMFRTSFSSNQHCCAQRNGDGHPAATHKTMITRDKCILDSLPPPASLFSIAASLDRWASICVRTGGATSRRSSVLPESSGRLR